MKRFLALFVACMMAAMPALAATDYTVAEKLVKQLSAGSGFSGTITLEADTESFSTIKPRPVVPPVISPEGPTKAVIPKA